MFTNRQSTAILGYKRGIDSDLLSDKKKTLIEGSERGKDWPTPAINYSRRLPVNMDMDYGHWIKSTRECHIQTSNKEISFQTSVSSPLGPNCSHSFIPTGWRVFQGVHMTNHLHCIQIDPVILTSILLRRQKALIESRELNITYSPVLYCIYSPEL